MFLKFLCYFFYLETNDKPIQLENVEWADQFDWFILQQLFVHINRKFALRELAVNKNINIIFFKFYRLL